MKKWGNPEKKIIDLELSLDNNASETEIDLIQELSVELTVDGKMDLSQILIELKLKGYGLQGALIGIFNFLFNSYICMGADPQKGSCVIPFEEYVENNYMKMRVRISKEISIESQNIFLSEEMNTGKRPKERKIAFIVEKVSEWRRLYNGIVDQNGVNIKLSLEDAAEKVGMPKKSLDDYLLQLRMGKKYGFNFDKNKNEKMGLLRSFVKLHRQNKKRKCSKQFLS